MTAPNTVQPDTYADDSYWWLFRELLDRTKGAAVGSVPGVYPRRNALVRERFDALERSSRRNCRRWWSKHWPRATTGSDAAADVLDAFSARCVERTVAAVRELSG